jgi:hypothetical protein
VSWPWSLDRIERQALPWPLRSITVSLFFSFFLFFIYFF